jgi:hypothetical protein
MLSPSYFRHVLAKPLPYFTFWLTLIYKLIKHNHNADFEKCISINAIYNYKRTQIALHHSFLFCFPFLID